jgi:hypothetical protein
LFTGVRVLNVSPIVGLAKAGSEPGTCHETEIAIQERDNRDQRAARLPSSGETHRLESRMKVFPQIGRINPEGNDREVVESRFNVQASRSSLREKRRCEKEIVDGHN